MNNGPLIQSSRSFCVWDTSWFQLPGMIISSQKMPGGLELLNPPRHPLEPSEIAPLLLLLYSLDCKFFPDPALWLQDKNLCLRCSTGGKNPLALAAGATTARRRDASAGSSPHPRLAQASPSRPRGRQAGQKH